MQCTDQKVAVCTPSARQTPTGKPTDSNTYATLQNGVRTLLYFWLNIEQLPISHTPFTKRVTMLCKVSCVCISDAMYTKPHGLHVHISFPYILAVI
jgi:hypothetical protein